MRVVGPAKRNHPARKLRGNASHQPDYATNQSPREWPGSASVLTPALLAIGMLTAVPSREK